MQATDSETGFWEVYLERIFAYKNCGGITGVVFFSSSGKQITDVNCNLREDGDLQS